MSKVDFIKVEGYVLHQCFGDIKDYRVLKTPVIGLYVERGCWVIDVLTTYGRVVELNSLCVLKSPDGKFSYADQLFKDQVAWLEWAFSFETITSEQAQEHGTVEYRGSAQEVLGTREFPRVKTRK